MRITTPQIIPRLHPRIPRTRKCLPIRHRPRRKTVPIHPIRPRAQNRNPLPRDPRHASQHKRRIPPADPVTRNRAAHFPTGKYRHAPPRIFTPQNFQLRQQMFRRLLQRPIVRLGIHQASKSLRLATMMRRVQQFPLPQQHFKSRPRKCSIAILRSLNARPPLNHSTQGSRQFRQQPIFPHHALGIIHRRRVRHRRPGSQRGFVPFWHIADRESYFQRTRRRGRESPTLGSRKMFPHYINFLDWRAASYQGRMQLLKIRKRHASIQGKFHQRRPPARNQKKYQRLLVAARQTLQNRLARRKTFRRRHGMPAHKCFPTRQRRRRRRRNHKNSIRRKFRRQNIVQTPRHPERSFPERDRHNFTEVP